jgi:hypothetical protein
MRRVQATADRELPAGLPELWRVVLDRMAENESVTTVTDALRCEVRGWLTDREDLEWAQGGASSRALACGSAIAGPPLLLAT